MAETKTRSLRLHRCALLLSMACASLAVERGAEAQAAPPPPVVAPKPAKPAKPAAKPPKKGDKTAARALYEKGKKLFEAKDYAGAKEAFTTADDTLPAAIVEYWIGRSLEELGDLPAALASYEKAYADPKLKTADDAKDRIGKLKSKPVKVKITAAGLAGATIKVDGAAIADKTPAEIDLAPGAHKIALSAAGMKDGEGDVTVAVLTPGAFDLKLEAVPSVPPPPPDGPAPGVAATPAPVASPAMTAPAPAAPPPPPPPSDKTWAYVTGGAAIVGIGVGTYFGIQALSDHSDYTAPGGATADLRDTGTHHALISDIGFGVGITLAVTSLVLFFGGDDGPESSITTRPVGAPMPTKPAAFAPYVIPSVGKSPSSAGATATFHF